MSVEARAWGWVAHLREGGVTPWTDWAASAEPLDVVLPGAQQLELLRRLNNAGRVDRALADRVLRADPPRRSRSGLPLTGGPEPVHGPRPVDPGTLADRELLHLTAVLLAQDLAAHPLSPPSRPGFTRPWRIRYHLAGDPEHTAVLRRHLVRHGRPPGGYGGRTVVVGTDLGQMFVDLWTAHSLRNGALPWQRWWRERRERGGLPRPLDLFGVAEAAARDSAPGRVHLVTEPHLALRQLGMRGRPPAPTPLAAHAVELGRFVSGSLRPLAVSGERHRRVTEVLRPLLAREDGPVLLPPADDHAWLTGEAERLRRLIATGRYPVHGDPAALLPAAPSARDGVETPDGSATFALATRLLVTGAVSGPGQGAEREEET
jgi:hypothetical protein